MDETIDSPPPGAVESMGVGASSTLESAAVVGRAATVGATPSDAAPSALYFLREGKAPIPILESVIGEDERARVLETAAAPWRMICSLRVSGPSGTVIGTGWLVGPTTVLTAGHCVHDPRIGGWATEITVTPGLNRDHVPHGRVVARRFSTLRAWIETQSQDDDVGVIHLDQDAVARDGAPSVRLGETLGTFGVAVRSDEALLQSFVHVAGYPGEAAKGFGTELWAHRSKITGATPKRLFYDVDTTAGQSGGPAFVVGEDKARPTVIAVHAYGLGGTPDALNLKANSAPRITPRLFELIERWIDRGAG